MGRGTLRRSFVRVNFGVSIVSRAFFRSRWSVEFDSALIIRYIFVAWWVGRSRANGRWRCDFPSIYRSKPRRTLVLQLGPFLGFVTIGRWSGRHRLFSKDRRSCSIKMMRTLAPRTLSVCLAELWCFDRTDLNLEDCSCCLISILHRSVRKQPIITRRVGRQTAEVHCNSYSDSMPCRCTKRSLAVLKILVEWS